MKFNTAAVITLLISASNVAASLPIVNLNLLATAVLLGKVPQASSDTPQPSSRPSTSSKPSSQANSEKVVGVTVKDNGLCYCHLTDANDVETTQYTHPYGKWFAFESTVNLIPAKLAAFGSTIVSALISAFKSTFGSTIVSAFKSAKLAAFGSTIVSALISAFKSAKLAAFESTVYIIQAELA
eukprot:scaffold1082_cov43-Cyclotella_meneghiniana.AAC.3